MSNHQKRISAPENYPVERKEGAYVVKAQGPHPEDKGVPLGVVVRDVLGYADDLSEVESLLSKGKILVNGRERKNARSTVGFMDVIGFPDIDEHYRVLVTGEGYFLHEVEDGEEELKIARVSGKTTLKGGETQLNLDDGNNIRSEEDYGTKGSVLVTAPGLDIEEEAGFEEGNLAYIRGGKHTGRIAEIQDIKVNAGSTPNTVTLEDDGDEFETVEENVYVVGEDEPLVQLPEVEER